MSEQDEVAQMVERLPTPEGLAEIVAYLRSQSQFNVAALLERLQRELTEAKAKVDGGRVEMVTDGYLAQLVSANHALRSWLEAAEARNEKLEQDRIGNLQWIADCGCEDPPSLDSFGCGGKCAPCSAAAFLAQRPAAEEQGT